MDKVIEILKSVKPGVDYKNEKSLVDNGILESFDIITIISKLNDEFDIEFSVNEVIPENFNSAEALYKTVCKLEEE